MHNKQTVLIVDDEPININMIAELLSDIYNIKIAGNGIKALEIVEKQKPDLILLDIHMPEMDGYEVARRLQADKKTKEIPFIFLTSRQESESIVRGFQLGAADYITKPFNREELLARVANHLKIYTIQRELNETLQQRDHSLKIIDRYVAYIKTDINGIITDVSARYCKKAKCSKSDLIGSHARVLKSENTSAETYRNLWQSVRREQIFNVEIENKNFRNGTNWYEVTILPDYHDKNLVGYIAFYEDIDEKIMIKKVSETDVLTGVYNRVKLDKAIEDEFARSKRYKHPFSVLLLDIDYFKKVNDTYGHQVGDKVLIDFARILQENTRKIDIVGRWGGEEFLIICPGTDIAQAGTVAEKLRLAIETHSFGEAGSKTASIGVAQFHEGEEIEAFFKKVDDALYEAKEGGRNRVVLAK